MIAQIKHLYLRIKNLSFLLIFIPLIMFSCNKTVESDFDKNLLMGAWGQSLEEDSDFRIGEDEFFIVDVFETSHYSLSHDTIIIVGSSYYETGTIKKLTADSLVIDWVDIGVTRRYIRLSQR